MALELRRNPEVAAVEPRLIKKYPNRRLYDTERSSYITVEDVRDLVLAGIEFKVVDAETQTDITRNILIQIITEHESGKQATFSTDMLAHFIRLSHDAAQDAFARWLDDSMRLFLSQQQRLGKQVEEALSGKALGELTRRNLELWQEWQASFLRAAGVEPRARRKNPGGGRRSK